MKAKLLSFILCGLFATNLYAETEIKYDMEIDGLRYRKLTESTVEVSTLSYMHLYDGGWSWSSADFTLQEVNIPATITYEGNTYIVVSIGMHGFGARESLTSITIPENVTSIEYEAFADCTGLTSITIPNGVTSIGNGAFRGCTGLTSITIGNSVTTIREQAFRGCTGLTSVTIPNSVTSIGDNAFSGVLNVVYTGTATGSPWGAWVINGYTEGYLAYEDATRTTLLICSRSATGEITIPNSVTSIGDNAFANCRNLTSVTIPNSVTSIGNGAFSGCRGLISMIVEGGNSTYDSRDDCNAIIETKSNTLIAGCKTTIIPINVTSIGNNAFSGCTGLTSITIPINVTSIIIGKTKGALFAKRKVHEKFKYVVTEADIKLVPASVV